MLRALVTKAAAIEPPVEGAAPPRVLVADDDAGIRNVLRAILEGSDYVVDEAANGAETLHLLQTSECHYIVLLDLWMPGLDGLDVLNAVVADPILSSLHAFALITADPRAAQRVNEHIAGTMRVPILAKPFDMDELLEFVAVLACSLDGRWPGGPNGPDSSDTPHSPS